VLGLPPYRAALPDNLEARFLEQARDALAEQHRVVSEDDAGPRRLAFFRVWGSVVDAVSVAENRRRDKQRRPSARRREQALDRRRGKLCLWQEAKRRAAGNESPEIGAVEARRQNYASG
jgi:hypothetical protein